MPPSLTVTQCLSYDGPSLRTYDPVYKSNPPEDKTVSYSNGNLLERSLKSHQLVPLSSRQDDFSPVNNKNKNKSKQSVEEKQHVGLNSFYKSVSRQKALYMLQKEYLKYAFLSMQNYQLDISQVDDESSPMVTSHLSLKK